MTVGFEYTYMNTSLESNSQFVEEKALRTYIRPFMVSFYALTGLDVIRSLFD